MNDDKIGDWVIVFAFCATATLVAIGIWTVVVWLIDHVRIV